MLDIEDVDIAVKTAMAEHEEAHHKPITLMPVRPFRAELEEDWIDSNVNPDCLVVGVTPCSSGLLDPDDMPSLNFVVIAPLSDGTIIPRIVPALRGSVPG